MLVLNDVRFYLDWVVWLAMFVLSVWAIVDCATRKAAAFPVAGKLTKPAWLAILLISGLLSALEATPIGVLPLIAVTAASVYLADVRPAVREISGGGHW